MKTFTKDQHEEIVQILLNDGIIAYPTDTVYGLCGRYDHQTIIDKLKDIKHRPEDKSFPLMVSDIKMLESIAIVDDRTSKIVNKFLPGPLTMILKCKPSIKPWMNDGKDTIAVRMATDDDLKMIIQILNMPLYMTSANVSGNKPIETYEEITNQLNVDGVIQGLPERNQASTILDCTGKELEILRQGPLNLNHFKNL